MLIRNKLHSKEGCSTGSALIAAAKIRYLLQDAENVMEKT